MCTNPKTITREGYYKEDNYNGKKGEPYRIITYSKCGSCKQCIAEKANNWVIRNDYESKAYKKICFITLTYKDNPKFLIKKDLQDFIKRFRRRIEYHGYKEKIRYFAVGEYGTLKGRPHYHIIIYNWADKNAKYIGTNKKMNILFKSELIESVWGKGLTTYQIFDNHEIPYISLYATPQEQFKKAYKIKRETAKKIYSELNNKRKIEIEDYKSRLNKIKTLKKAIIESEKKKNEYIAIKEFNIWSKALGWEEFKANYNPKIKVFKEYIEDKEFLTPTPWIKKLANKFNDKSAIEEMKKRAKYEIEMNLTAEDKATINKLEELIKNKKDVLEWDTKKRKIEDL